jgi:RNA polymerase sigma-B factor
VTVSPSTRQRLIEAHLPLVRAVARRYAGPDEPLEDLVQIGAIGLIKAVDRYDAGRGVALPAYAAAAIAGEIRHHLRDRCAPVRVPRRLQADGVRVTAVTLDSATERSDGADPIVEAQNRVALGAALRSLQPRERRIVQLRFAEDLSQAQIAARTGLSQVHVSRLLQAALRRLGEQLAPTSTNGQTGRVAVEARWP